MRGPLAVHRRAGGAGAARRAPAWALAAALGVIAPLAGAACILDSQGMLANNKTDAGASSSASGAGAGGAGGEGGEATTSGAGGFGGDGGAGGIEPVSPYAHRRAVSIAAGTAAVPAEYSVAIQLDHAALVMAQKSLQNGNDVRVYRTNGNDFEELHRVLDPTSAWNTASTTLWFRTRVDIPAEVTDSSYFIFYGDPGATKPPSDGAQVFMVWDNFDGNSIDPAWTFTPIGNATGMATQAGSVVAISGSTGDIWGKQDSFVFLHRKVTGDFVADAVVTAVGGMSDQWGKLGGVMIRESTLPGSRNRIMSPVRSAIGRTNSYRVKDGETTLEQQHGQELKTPEYDRVTRLGNKSTAHFSHDGKTYQKLGSEVTFTQALSPEILVGIPVCNLNAGTITVSVDWFRVRKLVAPEPAASVGAEEPGDF